MSKKGKNISGKNFEETVIIDSDNIKSGGVKLLVSAYAMSEFEFQELKSFRGGWVEWARRLFFASMWFIVVLIGKSIDTIIKNKPLNSILESYEIYTLAIAVLLFVLFWFLSLNYKSNKQKLIDKIEQYFKAN